MAIIFVCGVIVFLIACMAACSLANHEMLRRQKSAKVPGDAVPFTILMVVYALTVGTIVHLVWFSSAETFAKSLFAAMIGVGTSVAVFIILNDAYISGNSKFLVKQVVTAGTTTTVKRYESFDSALLKASQVIKENQCSAAIVEDLSGNELAVINATAHTKHSQGK